MKKRAFICIVSILYLINLQAQDYLNKFYESEIVIDETECEMLYGEVQKHISLYCAISGDTIYKIKSSSVLGDTLQLQRLSLTLCNKSVEWYYVWRKYYKTWYLGDLDYIDNRGIVKTFILFREDPKSVRRYSDYTQTPEFEEYYNIGEKTIDTDIILTFPKFFREIQGVKEE